MTHRHLLHRRLSHSAERHPDRLAVVDREEALTYSELEARSNRLAHLLGRLGVEKGDRVGIHLEKSLQAVVAVYGILKSGAAYVPLDSRAPSARLGYIAGDCGITCLVSGRSQARRWGELVIEGAPLRHLVVPDADEEAPPPPAGVALHPASALEEAPDGSPPVSVIDLDLAYILYTSGSTGNPKGVMISHRNGLAFVDWAVEELAVSSEDRLSSHAPFHFDLSIFDLFAASTAGASVHLVPPSISVFPIEVARFIDRQAISLWYSVPSILSLLTQHGNLEPGALPSLRAVIFAGEVFPTKYLSRLMRLLPHAEFHNWYGPTETNVCTAYRVPEMPPEDSGGIPIGRAISNVETFVLTDQGRRGAAGEVGELVVRGATVMRGYWGDPEKTASRLVPHPLTGDPGDLVYHTGDLVEELASGDYRFLGRRDHQIKSRGYRIELGEIETAIYAHPEVLECAVIAVPDEMISNRIQAYLVTRSPQAERELVEFCARRLPRYMIPERFEFREALPKTSTGKIDRQALASEGARS